MMHNPNMYKNFSAEHRRDLRGPNTGMLCGSERGIPGHEKSAVHHKGYEPIILVYGD
jgi:hypothetical protein